MNTASLYAICGIALFCIGVFGLAVYHNLLRKALAINIMSTGIFVFLVAIANRNSQEFPDPVLHALVLTGIVVAVCATALMLSLTLRLKMLSDEENNCRHKKGYTETLSKFEILTKKKPRD